MRTSNILTTPVHYGSVSSFNLSFEDSASFSSSFEHLIKLPPLRKDFSYPNPVPSGQRIRAAAVLPNIKSILDQLNAESGRQLDLAVNAKIVDADQRIKFIIYKGMTIYQGDHLAIRSRATSTLSSFDEFYFAIATDFWMTEDGRKYFTLRWLLPRHDQVFSGSRGDLRPDWFNLGPFHDRVETMEVIADVFYSPYKNDVTGEEILRRYFDTFGTSMTKSVSALASTASTVGQNLFRSEYSKATKKSKISKEAGELRAEMSSEMDDIPFSRINVDNTELAAKMLLSLI